MPLHRGLSTDGFEIRLYCRFVTIRDKQKIKPAHKYAIITKFSDL